MGLGPAGAGRPPGLASACATRVERITNLIMDRFDAAQFLAWRAWTSCWIAARWFRRRHRGLLTLGVSAIIGALVLVACGDPPRSGQTASERTPTVQQVGLRPRASAAVATTAEAIAPAATTVAAPQTGVAGSAPGFVRVAVGEDHACALQASGRVQCWGANDEGQLDAPEDVEFQEVTAGYRFTCGIRTDGEISCWGQNDHGQLDAPDGQFTIIDAGWDHVCALSGGVATCWGWNANERATPPPGAALTAIGAGAEHSCGLTLDGGLECWGKNDDGRADTRQGPFRSLAVGIAHSCVLRSDGIVVCQGDNSAGQTDAPDAVFREISAGTDHSCGLRPNGTVHCWGASQGQASSDPLAAPAGAFTSISAGWKVTCALTENGFAQCWEYPSPVRPAPPFDRLNFVNASPGHLFSQPTEVFPWPPGGIAVADRTGFVSRYVAGSDPEPVLNLTDIVDSEGSLNGMLSAAVDPEFDEFPFLYVYYTVRDGQHGGKESTRLTRFPVVDGRAVREEALLILEIPMLPRPTYGYEGSSHYGGSIRFGSDGMLYLGIGDSHCYKCPQSLESLHGKIIRIDVRGASPEQPYRVPDDNPFLKTPFARPEIWAYGVRNPWRMTIDAKTGALWVGDVGHESEEEVTIATSGSNLGWPALEGKTCVTINESMTRNYGVDTKGYACSDFEDAVEPIVTYELTKEACAVIGGVVYRGTAVPWMVGRYLFGDFCSGQVWTLDGDADAGWRMVQIADLGRPISSFGTDSAGEVHVLTFGGPILRLVQAESGFVPSMTIMPSTAVEPPETWG